MFTTEGIRTVWLHSSKWSVITLLPESCVENKNDNVREPNSVITSVLYLSFNFKGYCGSEDSARIYTDVGVFIVQHGLL
jgi:hypothetical protein